MGSTVKETLSECDVKLLEEFLLTKLPRLVILTDEFLEDVLPQAGKLCFQRYDHVNELCMLISEFKKELS